MHTVPLPVVLALTYFAVNFLLMLWIVREESNGRAVSDGLLGTARMLRYGPPVLGFLYLVTIAGDWPFVLFVGLFFIGAFWLLDGLLNYVSRPPKR